jgi:structural maintenance of chromosome 2
MLPRYVNYPQLYLSELKSLFLKLQHEEVSAKLQAELAALTRFDEEVKGLDKAIARIKEEITDAELGVRKAEHDMQTAQKEKASTMAHVASLEKHHPWIQEEKRSKDC